MVGKPSNGLWTSYYNEIHFAVVIKNKVKTPSRCGCNSIVWAAKKCSPVDDHDDEYDEWHRATMTMTISMTMTTTMTISMTTTMRFARMRGGGGVSPDDSLLCFVSSLSSTLNSRHYVSFFGAWPTSGSRFCAISASLLALFAPPGREGGGGEGGGEEGGGGGRRIAAWRRQQGNAKNYAIEKLQYI